MSKLSNAITMIELLNSGKKYSIDELSNILEVTPRMVRIYKEEIEKSGIYIDTIRGPYGGYVLNKSIRIPTRKFNSNDVKLLSNLIEKTKDINEQKKLEILKDKIRGIYQGSKVEQKESNILNNEKYNVLSRAIKQRKKVEILYYSYNKGENTRIIHPYDMFLTERGWGCAAYCEKRKDMRHFELDRIRKIKLLDEFYE